MSTIIPKEDDYKPKVVAEIEKKAQKVQNTT